MRMSSSSVLLDVHTDHTDDKGQGAQDVYLHFHTAPDGSAENTFLFFFCVAWRPQRLGLYGLLWTRTAQDGHLDFHGTAPDLGREHLPLLLLCCLASSKTIRTVMDGEPRTATSTFTQLPTSAENTFLFFFFYVAWRPQRLYGLLWTGNPGRPPRLSRHSSGAQL